MTGTSRGLIGRLSRYTLVIILLIAFAGVATYAAMSDTSIHGLTVKFYNVTWACSPTGQTSPNQFIVFKFGSVVVYSSASLPTTLSKVSFSMSTNGIQVGTVTAPDASFSAGQNAVYTPTFNGTGLAPGSQPLASLIVLTINAHVSAGIYGSQASSSDSETVRFSSPPC